MTVVVPVVLVVQGLSVGTDALNPTCLLCKAYAVISYYSVLEL